MDILTTALPELSGVEYSGRCSSSSGIYKTDTGEPYRSSGLHVYIPFVGDIKEFQTFMKVKLWNAGLGYIGFARNGAMLERCVIDLTVMSPERLIYEAPPTLSDGISRKQPVWTHQSGSRFNFTSGISQSEQAEYERRVSEAKKRTTTTDNAKRLNQNYRAEQIQKSMTASGMSQAAAERLHPAQSTEQTNSATQYLPLSFRLELGTKVITVAELIQEGDQLNGISLPDPIEGRSYGSTTAKYYFNQGTTPLIYSLAHGQAKKYYLGQEDPGSHEHRPQLSLEKYMASGEQFQVIDQPARETAASTSLKKFSMNGQSEELESRALAERFALKDLALTGQWTVIYAKPNTGKTLLVLSLLDDAIRSQQISAEDVYYINVDDTHSGLLDKLKIAEEIGFNMLSEGYSGFKIADFTNHLRIMTESGDAHRAIIVLDTLKKFTDLMDKRKSSQFGELVRAFVVKGGTVIALAHVNKNSDANGKAVYAGTSDIIDDADCAYILDEVSKNEDIKTVEFTNRKNRGNVIDQVAFSYCTKKGISYQELLASICSVDNSNVGALKKAEEVKSDEDLINAISSCIQAGITTKMKLRDAIAERTGASKRQALHTIEKYGPDKSKVPLWSYKRIGRGALSFYLTDAT